MENEYNSELRPKKEKALKKEINEWVKSIALAILLAVFIRMFLLETFLVDGSSMYPTLKHNERLIVNKAVYYFKKPEQGDIIVFNYQSRPRRDFIKRVVALEGDRVEIKDGSLFVNGELIEEPYLYNNYGMADYGPYVVPEDHIFVLGDNRNNSMDSRDDQVGAISLEQVRGKAFLVFWPPFHARLLSSR